MPTSISSSSSSLSSIFSIAPHSPSPMAINARCIEELHFDVPLISTRRSSKLNHVHDTSVYSTDTSRSVPFLWERAPGVPKDRDEEEVVYTPRPPPGRWRPGNAKEGDQDDDNDSYAYSDALEKISLSESQGIPCRLSVSKDTGPVVNRAPSFIMNRFLPAANALAASSVLPKYSTQKARSAKVSDARRLASPSKSCGIMLLFPFGMKRAVCGLKSPVRCQTPKMASSRIDRAAINVGKDGDDHVSLSSDDGLSSKAWKSPGWGLPFLESSCRMRRSMGKREEGPKRKEEGRSMPRLKTPSEPWLANALSSVNRKTLN